MKRTEIALAMALAVCLGFVACAQQAEEEAAAGMEMAAMDMAAVDMAMSEIETAWKQAYDAGDAAGIAALYTDDAIYMAPYMEATRGRAAVEARMTEQMGMTSSRQITINRTDYGGGGDVTFGVGTYGVEMQMTGAAGPMTDSGKYVTIAKRGADGSWKIHVHIWNTNMSQADVVKMLSAMAAMSEM